MPELPEVETTRLGILPFVVGQKIMQTIVRVPRLRHILLPNLSEKLQGLTVQNVLRRGKYLLFEFTNPPKKSGLIVHLGMSGTLRVLPLSPLAQEMPALQKHDHVDFIFADCLLRYNDPRRFGMILWHENTPLEQHPLIAVLGIEPFDQKFNGKWLLKATRKKKTPIKNLLMNSHFMTGIGNIYAAESLFLARILPWKNAGDLSVNNCHLLAKAIQTTLNKALKAGGSSLRNYVQSSGERGFFQLETKVYGRFNQPCCVCQAPIQKIVQAGRSTFFCAHCQV